MDRRHRERGQSKLGAILWILLLIFGAMLGFQMIPAKIAAAQLEDHIVDLAQRAPHRDAKFYEQEIRERAAELELPALGKEAVTIKKGPERIIADVDVVVPVDLMVYSFDWHISIHVDREIFII